MSEVQHIRLGEIITVDHGFAFPGGFFSSDLRFPILVTPGNFEIGGGFKVTISPKTFKGAYSEAYVLSPGDLLITMTDLSKAGDTLGLPAVVPDDGNTYLHNQRIGKVRIIEPHLVASKFLSYYLRTDRYRKHILSTASGSTVRHTSPARITDFEADLPSMAKQLAIAELLGALDDKIAANVTLTQLIDELLATWLADALARESVRIVPLGEIASVNAAVLRPGNGQLRYIDIAAVGVGSFEYPELTDWADAPSRARRKVSLGDTLWSSVRPNRRSHALNLIDDSSLVASTGLAVLTPVRTGFAYLYEVTKRREFSDYLETIAEGSAYPAVRADRFDAAPVSLLPDDARNQFESVAAPMRWRAHSATVENRLLAKLRDALLPDLMSGKLRVPDAEEQVEAVM